MGAIAIMRLCNHYCISLCSGLVPTRCLKAQFVHFPSLVNAISPQGGICLISNACSTTLVPSRGTNYNAFVFSREQELNRPYMILIENKGHLGSRAIVGCSGV